MDENEELTLKSFEEISYFDNLALYYLCNETPPQTLALAFWSVIVKFAVLCLEFSKEKEDNTYIS